MSGILILCLSLLSILAKVWSEQTSSMVQLPLSESSHVKLETGIDPNHLLVIECTNSNKLVQLKCTLTIHLTDGSTDSCHPTLTANEDMNNIELLSIHQLNNNKVMVIWGDMEPRKGTSSHYQSIFYNKRITIVDMQRCSVVKTLIHRYFLGTRRRLQAVVPFDQGFDAVVTCHPYYENCSSTRESYDVYGNEFGQVEALPVQLDHISALPVAKKDRSEGIFVYGTYNFPKTNVSRVVKGNVKRSLNLRTDIRQTVSHADGEGSLVICGRVIGKARTVECTYFDAMNNKIVESRASLPGWVDVVAVRRLKTGRLLLFAIDGNSIIVVEVRDDRPAAIHNRQIGWHASAGKCKVRGFDEQAGNFGFVCETHVEGKRSLVTQNFELPSRLRDNSTEA